MNMRRLSLIFALAAAPAFATPPAAPNPTVGATDIKQLQFDWPSVPRSNTYELWFKANDGAAWVKYGETIAQRPRIRTNVSVHLLDWRVAKFRVAACNPSGCTASAELGVDDLALDAIGYLKPLGAAKNFGHKVTISADGRTAAVVSGERTGAYDNSIVVHVYRKTTGTSGWRRQARLSAWIGQTDSSRISTGNPVALSGDGDLLALGVPTAIRDEKPDAGVVFLFRFRGGEWGLEANIASYAANDLWGREVDLDDAGQLLAISRRNRSYDRDGGTYLFHLVSTPSGPSWQPVTEILAPKGTTAEPVSCDSLALSGDGTTLARTCRVDGLNRIQVLTSGDWQQTLNVMAGDNSGVDVSYDGTRFVLHNKFAGGAEVYRLEDGNWYADGFLEYGADSPIQHGSVSISRDGRLIAAGSSADNTAGFGPVYPRAAAGPTGTGSVFVYELKARGWQLRRVMKPSAATTQGFGYSVALGDNGRALIVGAPEDSSAALGIDGDFTDTSAPSRGAAWLY